MLDDNLKVFYNKDVIRNALNKSKKSKSNPLRNVTEDDFGKIVDCYVDYLNHIVYDEEDSNVVRMRGMGDFVLSLKKLRKKNIGKDYNEDWYEFKKRHLFKQIPEGYFFTAHDQTPAIFCQGLNSENKIRRYDLHGLKEPEKYDDQYDNIAARFFRKFTAQELEYYQAVKFFKEDVDYYNRKDLIEEFVRTPKDIIEDEETIKNIASKVYEKRKAQARLAKEKRGDL